MKTADRVLVLMYHRVGALNDASEARYCITPQHFAEQLHALAARGYRAVPVDALVRWLEGGPALAEGDFVLTFDDGFRGVREHALPVLQALGWPCTIFLVTDRLGGVDGWDRKGREGAPTYPLLDANEIADMRRRGCSFHSHTRSHASLTALDDAALARERATLETLVGDGDRYLAYPYGHVDDRVEAATRAAGYRMAFSVQPGFNRRGVNPFRLRRLDVFGTDSAAQLLRKMHLGSNDGSVGAALRYYAGRLAGRLGGGGA